MCVLVYVFITAAVFVFESSTDFQCSFHIGALHAGFVSMFAFALLSSLLFSQWFALTPHTHTHAPALSLCCCFFLIGKLLKRDKRGIAVLRRGFDFVFVRFRLGFNYLFLFSPSLCFALFLVTLSLGASQVVLLCVCSHTVSVSLCIFSFLLFV